MRHQAWFSETCRRVLAGAVGGALRAPEGKAAKLGSEMRSALSLVGSYPGGDHKTEYLFCFMLGSMRLVGGLVNNRTVIL